MSENLTLPEKDLELLENKIESLLLQGADRNQLMKIILEAYQLGNTLFDRQRQELLEGLYDGDN